MRRFLVRALARFAYWSGIDALFYVLNRNAKRIVTFHNVLPDDLFRDNIANGVSNRLSDFIAIVKECGRHFRFSTDMFDTESLTITFDDGYRCQYTVAFRALAKLHIPAYVFVAGDVKKGDGLIVDRLLHWVAEVPLKYIPNGDRKSYWTQTIWPRFMNDSLTKGMSVFEELDTIYPYSEILKILPEAYRIERFGAITESERNEMRNHGWKVGWHTWSHFPVSKLTNEELLEALSAPMEYRSTCLSYPFGNPVEVGAKAIAAAEKMGYPCAVSNTNCNAGGKYFLPRMSFVASDKYAVNFELSGFKHFLKHKRMLPCLSI